jgi:hypothetical protein
VQYIHKLYENRKCYCVTLGFDESEVECRTLAIFETAADRFDEMMDEELFDSME